jgi:hypothetical protein
MTYAPLYVSAVQLFSTLLAAAHAGLYLGSPRDSFVGTVIELINRGAAGYHANLSDEGFAISSSDIIIGNISFIFHKSSLTPWNWKVVTVIISSFSLVTLSIPQGLCTCLISSPTTFFCLDQVNASIIKMWNRNDLLVVS